MWGDSTQKIEGENTTIKIRIVAECELDPCPDYIGASSESGHGDTFENPDRRSRVFGEARRHARRTGHTVIIDRHSRLTIKSNQKNMKS